jgi:N-formylglutamate deformylase
MDPDSSAVLLSPGTTALVLDSPHSGSHYPEDFRPACSFEALRSVEDSFVDELWGFAGKLDVPLLSATFPRSYIDANRSVRDIDPALLDQPWPGPTEDGAEVRLGKGLVWRLLDDGTCIYDRRLGIAEVARRIDRCWRPYHEALSRLVGECHRRHGHVIHLNCHSMPAVPGPCSTGHPGLVRADFVLGDRDGRTADPRLTRAVAWFLGDLGHSVGINHPHKGGELVREQGHPAANRHSIQIEVNKRLYMDEHSRKLHAGFLAVRRVLEELTRFLLAEGKSLTGPPRECH